MTPTAYHCPTIGAFQDADSSRSAKLALPSHIRTLLLLTFRPPYTISIRSNLFCETEVQWQPYVQDRGESQGQDSGEWGMAGESQHSTEGEKRKQQFLLFRTGQGDFPIWVIRDRTEH